MAEEKPKDPKPGERWFDEETGYLMEWDPEEELWVRIESSPLPDDAPFPCPACGHPMSGDGFCENPKCETAK